MANSMGGVRSVVRLIPYRELHSRAEGGAVFVIHTAVT